MAKQEKKQKNNKNITENNKNKKNNEEEKEFYTHKEVVVITVTALLFGSFLGVILSFNTVNKSNSKEVEEFITAYSTLVNSYYKEIDKSKLISAAINGMFDYLDDPYTIYMDKEEANSFNETMDGKYKGIGATITSKDNKIYIIDLFKNSPGEKAGLKVNDEIISVNKKSTKGKTTDEVVNLIKSKDTATIKVKRNDKEKTYKVVLEEINIPSVESKVLEKNNKKVGLITLSIFAANTYDQFNTQLKSLEKQNVDGIIIDVRDNGGGYLDQASDIISSFMDKSHVIYQIESNGKKKKYYSTGSINKKYKIAVLINQGSASASEVLTAALKESYNAEVVGKKTYGKGTVQVEQKLKSGASIKLTIENWLTPKGDSINKKGIEPTKEVELSDEYYNNPSIETDNQLQEALDLITKK